MLYEVVVGHRYNRTPVPASRSLRSPTCSTTRPTTTRVLPDKHRLSYCVSRMYTLVCVVMYPASFTSSFGEKFPNGTWLTASIDALLSKGTKLKYIVYTHRHWVSCTRRIPRFMFSRPLSFLGARGRGSGTCGFHRLKHSLQVSHLASGGRLFESSRVVSWRNGMNDDQ